MELKHVTVEQAFALQKLGFPQTNTEYGWLQPCDCYFTGRYSYEGAYHNEREYFEQENKFHSFTDWMYRNSLFYGMSVEAPTLELAAQWLREENDVKLYVLPLSVWAPKEGYKDNEYFYFGPWQTELVSSGLTYDEALSEGIDRAIEYLNVDIKRLPKEQLERTIANMTDKEIADAFKQIIKKTGDCQSPTIEDYLEFLRTCKIEKQG